MLNAATLIATLALCAAALPAPNEPVDNLKRATVELNGHLVDCDQTAFLDIYPPSEIELKCRAAQGIPSNFIRRDVDLNARDNIVEFEGRQINCDEIAFLAVMPPSPLELKCRGAGEKRDPIPIEGGWRVAQRDAKPITGVVVGKRQVVDFKGGKLNCANLVFPAVLPPSEAEVACRGG